MAALHDTSGWSTYLWLEVVGSGRLPNVRIDRALQYDGEQERQVDESRRDHFKLPEDARRPTGNN